LVIYGTGVPPIYEFALYRLDQGGSAGGMAIPGPFDVVLYSRYKYGSTVAAGWFGRTLGPALLSRYPRHGIGEVVGDLRLIAVGS
jgi:hypothetical protein